jgi:hypothetical protein
MHQLEDVGLRILSVGNLDLVGDGTAALFKARGITGVYPKYSGVGRLRVREVGELNS